MSADISDDSYGPNGLMRNTHLLDWLADGHTNCQHGTKEWCEAYLHNAKAVIEAQDERIRRLLDHIAELEARTERLGRTLALMPMAERLAELPDFMVALSEWGCTEPREQAQSITEFLNSLIGLREYLENATPKEAHHG